MAVFFTDFKIFNLHPSCKSRTSGMQLQSSTNNVNREPISELISVTVSVFRHVNREIKICIRIRLIFQREMPPLFRQRAETIVHHSFTENHAVVNLFLRQCFRVVVGLSMMCYTEGKASKVCLGEHQLRGLIGKLLY